MSGTGAKMKADVGDDHVSFRGAYKGDVPFEEIIAEARGTLLVLSFRGNVVEVGAGARASQIAAKIRSPPSRLDRMGIETGMSASVAGPVDALFRSELATRAFVSAGLPRNPVDILVFAITEAGHLEPLPKLAGLVDPKGALWLLHPDALQAKAIAAGRSAGLGHSRSLRFAAGVTASRFVRAA